MGKADAEKNKLIDHMNEKMNDIGHMEEVIQKTKKSYKRFEENDIIQQEKILMLEGTLESREHKILEIGKDLLRTQEELSIPCVNCAKAAATQTDLGCHDESNHSDENAPTTSKCGTCEYQSDGEEDLRVHLNTHLKHSCDKCDYETDLQYEFMTHKSLEHNKGCTECRQTFITEEKLEKHVCKIDTGNPSFEHFYSRSWMDSNNCNKIYCNNIKQEVAILHCEKCVKSERSCCWAPYILSGQSSGVTHLEFKKYTKEFIFKNREIKWPELVKALI